MRPIQFILILGLLASLGLYYYAFRSTLRDRILVLGFLLCGLLAVLFPDSTSVIAEMLGVGRGSDLIMYLFFVASIFFAVLFYFEAEPDRAIADGAGPRLAIETARPGEAGAAGIEGDGAAVRSKGDFDA